MAFLTSNANASLNDDFVYSSKLGLTTESVTSSWTKAENGLSFGGHLNGVPRDTWHDLYYLDNKLALVVIGYHPENDKFERVLNVEDALAIYIPALTPFPDTSAKVK